MNKTHKNKNNKNESWNDKELKLQLSAIGK